jgi:hypothetical protein
MFSYFIKSQPFKTKWRLINIQRGRPAHIVDLLPLSPGRVDGQSTSSQPLTTFHWSSKNQISPPVVTNYPVAFNPRHPPRSFCNSDLFLFAFLIFFCLKSRVANKGRERLLVAGESDWTTACWVSFCWALFVTWFFYSMRQSLNFISFLFCSKLNYAGLMGF